MTGAAGDRGAPPTPYALLVAVGLGAVAIGTVAFLLWGTQGGAYLLDLVAAYCF